MKFFLRGVEEVSEEAINSSRQIFAMREQHRELLSNSLGNGAASGLRLLDYLYEQPIVNIRLVEKHLRSSFVTANRLIEQFVKLNIIKETTGGQRNRRYSYFPYLALFESSATAHQDKSPSV
jgi:Fic family protein